MANTLKSIHVPFCFYPGPVGGTEVYVERLARGLRQLGHEASIAAPSSDAARYLYGRIPVVRYTVSERVGDLRELYGGGDEASARRFGFILDEEMPRILHLHALTRGVSLRLVREARRRGIKTVFTYHTPTVSCQRGTLLRWGKDLCDGALDARKCAGCALHGLGLSRLQSAVVTGLPVVGRLAGASGLSGGLWTALRMPELVGLRQNSFRELMREVDAVVVLCDWARDLLRRNGVPAEKIFLSRHGLAQTPLDEGGETPDGPRRGAARGETEGRLRLAFLGRFDSTKGPDVLIRALQLIPEADVELHLYGIVQGAGGDAYTAYLISLVGDDRRIVFKSPVASGDVIGLLSAYDILAVPSQCLETGPLVVLEAFAAGTPVLGSSLGGIAELVEHGVNGMLVEAGSAQAWARAIRRLEDRSLLARLRSGIRRPRGMDAVALEMSALYERVSSQIA